MLNETGFWRLLIAGLMGVMAAAASAVVAAGWRIIRREVPLEVPIMTGIGVAVAAYLIDWYTERRQPHE